MVEPILTFPYQINCGSFQRNFYITAERNNTKTDGPLHNTWTNKLHMSVKEGGCQAKNQCADGHPLTINNDQISFSPYWWRFSIWAEQNWTNVAGKNNLEKRNLSSFFSSLLLVMQDFYQSLPGQRLLPSSLCSFSRAIIRKTMGEDLEWRCIQTHHLEVVSTERTQTQGKSSPPQVDQQPTVGLPNKSRPGLNCDL